MLTFLTLLLGLVWGPQEIELAVGEGVALVEIRLDDEPVATLRAPPWVVVVDFGAPAPHHLDAIAWNARGVEIGRTRQRVNFPRPPAEAALMLLPGAGGSGRVARLTWENSIGGKPENVTLTFDGKALAAPDLERIELPAFAPERLHFLRAIASFPTGVSATAELTFGGRRHDDTGKALTAIPVRAPGGKLPAPEKMEGWFLANGVPLHALAVEQGEPYIVLVFDADGPTPFQQMQRDRLFATTSSLRGKPPVRILLAYPDSRRGARGQYEIFPRSYPILPGDGLLSLLAEVSAAGNERQCPRLADAVSAVALNAAEYSHPRAVVLVLTGNPDASVQSVRNARSFLSDLGVPLVVWTTSPAAPDAALDWGEARSVRTRGELRAAMKALDDILDEQRILWVEGSYLPQSIFPSLKAAPGVTVAR